MTSDKNNSNILHSAKILRLVVKVSFLFVCFAIWSHAEMNRADFVSIMSLNGSGFRKKGGGSRTGLNSHYLSCSHRKGKYIKLRWTEWQNKADTPKPNNKNPTANCTRRESLTAWQQLLWQQLLWQPIRAGKHYSTWWPLSPTTVFGATPTSIQHRIFFFSPCWMNMAE